MYRRFVEARILSRQGHPINAQYHVVLTDAKGNKEFLWISSVNYIDWIEDPLILTGQTMLIDTEKCKAFA